MAMTRDELLDAAIEYAARQGLAEFSMRSCAAAIGTSHRMLGYHFGTKDQLLTTIIDTAAARQRATIDAFLAARATLQAPLSGDDVDEAMSTLLVDEDALRFAPLMAEGTYRIARHPGLYRGDAPTYEDIVSLWTPALIQLFEMAELPEGQRRARARLAVAVLVGLSIDYLGTRDGAAYVAAYRDWIRLTLGI